MAEQTIAELYGLNLDDPWDKRTEQQKAFDAKLSALREAIEHPSPTKPADLIDPPDDDSNLTIREDAPGRVFHRLSVTGTKLAALLSLEPSLINISATARNTSVGCWVALTGHRVAQQMAKRIEAHGYSVTLAMVDGSGTLLKPLSTNERDTLMQNLGKKD